MSVPEGSRPAAPRPYPVALTVLAHVLLLGLGILLALYGGFLVPRGPRPGGHLLSVGVLVAVVGNIVAVRLGARAAGRYGGITPLVGWVLTAFTLTVQRPSGSLVLAGGNLSTSTLLFLALGALAGALAAAGAGRGVLGRRR